MKWHVVEASEKLPHKCSQCGRVVTSGDFCIAWDFEGNEAEWIEHCWDVDAATDFGLCARCLGDPPSMNRQLSGPQKRKWTQFAASGIMRRL